MSGEPRGRQPSSPTAARLGILPCWGWLLLLAAGGPAGAAERPGPEVLWRIGNGDDSPAEFALGEKGEYSRYPELFPEDAVFVTGKSAPREHLPYIHPGPKDAWAGSRAHSVTVRFELAGEPTGTMVLLLDLTRSHYAYPPVLTVLVNDTEIGRVGTDRDGHHQEKYVLVPARAFRRGVNTLRIENRQGSWAVYDALRLDRFPPGVPVERISGLRFQDTVYFREIDGRLHQVVHARVDGLWDGQGTFRLRGPDFVREYAAAEALLDPGVYELPFPAPTRPFPCSLELVTSTRTVPATEVRVIAPHRRWTVYAALKTHYDLGYTHPIDEMLANAAGEMLEQVLEHCEETRDFPADTGFRWVYPTWVLEKIREQAPGRLRPRLEEALRRGEIRWHALPFTLHSYFCGMEDIVRGLYPGAELEQKCGRQVRWAKQTDVPGHTRFLPQVLSRSGIRLLQVGANFGVRGQKMPLLFYWESPDGSRVLTQFTTGYGWGFDSDRLVALEQDPDYPWDAFLALHVTGDNVGPSDLVEVARTARRLAERYAYPRLRIGPVEEFVDAVEREHRDRIPVVRTEMTDWWIHGVASMAREVSLARRARERLTAAERIWSAALLARPSLEHRGDLFERAYEQSLLFSEHTWGMAGFKPEPRARDSRDLETNESEGYRQMRRSWEAKGARAAGAWKLARYLGGMGLQELAEASGCPMGSVIVFNPLNRTRTALVRLHRRDPVRNPQAVRELATGREVLWQIDGEDLVFLASDVPPMGHSTYVVEPRPPGTEELKTPTSPSRDILENQWYRITVDPSAGAVRSIVDKRDGRELVDAEAPFRLGQYVYEGMGRIGHAGWHGSPYGGEGTGRLVPSMQRSWIEHGPVFTRFVAEGSLSIEDFPLEIGSVERVVSSITLPHHLDWIECEVRLEGKHPTALVEQGNVAFPFLVKDGKFRLEMLGSVVDPASDLQESGNHDSFAVQHWVDISGPAGGVTWSPIDTTIVTLGDLRLFQWDGAYVPGNTRLYANALNNGWSTNFQEWQGGDFRFRFRLRSHEGDWVEGGAARFGTETAQPLLAEVVLRERDFDVTPRLRASHLTAEAEHVIVVNLKPAEDGDGLILRLYNPAPHDDTVRVGSPGSALRSAVRVLATEGPLPEDAGGSPLPLQDGKCKLKVSPFALETLRLRL